MGNRMEEKKKQKQEALLTSAFQLFTAQGINNTSISDIVKKAKMAKGTFYLYFKDKYDIRDKLITHKANQIFEKAHQLLMENDIEGLEERVVFIADNVIDQLNENQSLLRFISKNLSWAMFSKIRIPDMDNMNCMDIFERLIEESGRRFRQKELMIYMIVELVSASCYNVVLEGSPCTLEELKPELYQSIRMMIAQFEIVAGTES
ncbi:MAG: TetR/AcrR family transcriptional regulator [Lachnospiraceae bacterium]|nr:TetR/AcrR family transcriptional regulator [Lachnospiraceae bacterium]